MRPKPQHGTTPAIRRELLQEWIAEAMQDAAERMEAAVEGLAELLARMPCPLCSGTGFQTFGLGSRSQLCIRCGGTGRC